MEDDYKNIPKSLRKRRGERAIITLLFGFIPLFLGVFGLYRYITMPEETIIDANEFKIHYQDRCLSKELDENCLTIVINEFKNPFIQVCHQKKKRNI